MRALARSIHVEHRGRWTINDAMAFAELLIANPYLEAKAVGIEVVARYRRSFRPPLLERFPARKREELLRVTKRQARPRRAALQA